MESLDKKVLKLFNKNADIATRKLTAGGKQIFLFFIDCLIDLELMTNAIIEPIKKLKADGDTIKELEEKLLGVGAVKKLTNLSDIPEEIFNASVVIGVEKEKEFLAVTTPGYQMRSIAEPPTSSVVRGPREGFIEDLETNLSMLRRRLKTPSLAIKRQNLGTRTKSKIALVYLEGVVNPNIVKKLEKSLKQINIDGIIDSYYLEELLEESNEKFFKKLGNSEKPDVVAARILEGRVAILVDGSPIALSVPFIFMEDLQSPGDYYDISPRTTFVRILRVTGLLLAILLPGMYVALQSFHYRVLPLNFLISLLNSIEGISFPPIIEILFVLFLFEILNEASVRMPKQLGMALSIIGALVLGDTAVQAGIITPPSIVVVAISGITLYIIPNQASEATLLRAIFTVVGGFAGFYGIFLAFIILATYLVSIQSYGAAYMAPYAPSVATDKKDGFIKVPLSRMIYRPKSYITLNTVRQQPSQNAKYKVKSRKKDKLKKDSEEEYGAD